MASPEFSDPLAAIEWLRARRREVPRDVVEPTPAPPLVDDARQWPPIILDGGHTHLWNETVENEDGTIDSVARCNSLTSDDHE